MMKNAGIDMSGESMKSKTHREGGFILIQVLMLFFIAASLIFSLSGYVSSLERTSRDMIKMDDMKVEMRSAVYQCIGRMSGEEFGILAGKTQSQNKKSAGVELLIEDESGKIDLKPYTDTLGLPLNPKKDDILSSLFGLLHLGTQDLQSFKNDLMGLDRGLVENLGSAQELKQRGGQDLSRYMTFYSDGRINILSASGEVLNALFGNAKAEDILAIREDLKDRPFTWEDFGMLDPQDRDKVTTVSRFYKIQAILQGTKARVVAVIEKDSDKIYIREWIEE